MFHYTGGCMFKAIPIPDHLADKIKKRDGTREEFIKGLINMKAGTMVEVPDTQYKYATVRGRVSEANKWLRGAKLDKRLITTRQNGSTSTLVMCHEV
jgi:hypothetical protein